MIAALLCRCGGAEPLARKFFTEHNVPDPMSVPVYHGKVSSQNFLSTLPDLTDGPDTVASLQSFLTGAGGFVVIIGWDDTHFMWSNIRRGGVPAIADAELILEQFA